MIHLPFMGGWTVKFPRLIRIAGRVTVVTGPGLTQMIPFLLQIIRPILIKVLSSFIIRRPRLVFMLLICFIVRLKLSRGHVLISELPLLLTLSKWFMTFGSSVIFRVLRLIGLFIKFRDDT